MVKRSLALAISFMHRYVCPRSGQCSEAFKSDLGFAADIVALLAVDIRKFFQWYCQKSMSFHGSHPTFGGTSIIIRR